MKRSLAALLLLVTAALGQGVDDWIEKALDPRTGPDERADALRRIGQSKEALDKLADKGLDANRKPEVVHAVVETLLKAADYRPYIDRMCKLLLNEDHRENVLRRMQMLGDYPDRGKDLLEGLGAIAREATDPAMREAAVLALGRISRRRAAEIIVQVGIGSTDPQVAAVVRAYVRRLFPVQSVKEAAEYLEKHKNDTFWDLVERRIEQLLEQQEEQAKRVRDYLKSATWAEALKILLEGGDARLPAADRLRELAEQNAVPQPADFARALFEQALPSEMARETPDPKVLADLVGALIPYGRDPSGVLWQSKQPKEVRDRIQELATVKGNGPATQDLGSFAVTLLSAIDDEGSALNAFAESFPSVETRRAALQQLGALALRMPARRNYVGIKLAVLLSNNEAEPVLRAQILSLLTQNHIPVASKPDIGAVLRGFLEKGASPPLTDAELRDCTFVLGKSRTPEAKAALEKAATSNRDLKVRRFAVEEALLPWARVDPEIHDVLKGLILAADQPIEARRAVVEALGRKGGRRSAQTLAEVEASADLSPDLLPAVREAKLQLAERLANSGATEAPEQRADLEAACSLLEQGLNGDPERLEKIAGAIVRAADAAKLPAGTARYRMASLYRQRPAEKQDEATLLNLYQLAKANAATDGLPVELRETMLREYQGALLAKPDDDRLAKAASCAEELGDLAREKEDAVGAAAHYLDGADYAVRRKDRALAERLLNLARESTGVTGELVAREKELRAVAESLPRG